MTTAAELKARLAKYAPKSKQEQIPVAAVEGSNTAPSSQQGNLGAVVAGRDAAVAPVADSAAIASPVGKQHDSSESDSIGSSIPSVDAPVEHDNSATTGLQSSTAADTQQEVEESHHEQREQTTQTLTSAAAAEAIRIAAISAGTSRVAATGSDEVTVVTDVQSTDVVVVERPDSSADELRSNDDVGDSASNRTTDLDTSNPVHQNFLQRLSDLEAALLARDPLMKTHLGEIHKHMIQYEEIANLLRPEEISKIMAAQQVHTGIVLRAEVLGKSKAATNKKAAKLGVDDL